MGSTQMVRGAKNAYIKHVHTGGKENENIR